MTIDITSALIKLCPDSEWCVKDGVIEWQDKVNTQPSEKQIQDTIDELQADYDSKQYQRDRAEAYPELKEQLDLLYHDMTAGKGDKTGEWYKAVNKVKTDNPKPE